MGEQDLEKISHLRELSELLEKSKSVWYKTSPKNKIVLRLRKVTLSVLRSWSSVYPGRAWIPLDFDLKELRKCFKPREDPQIQIDWDGLRKRVCTLYSMINTTIGSNTPLVTQEEYFYKFVLGGKLYTFAAEGWDEISTKFARRFPHFELKMHDECSEEHDCPNRAQVHGEGEVADLWQLNFSEGDHREHWMWVS